MKSPIRVAITGSAGQISYILLFSIANGNLFGKDQPISLRMLDLSRAQTVNNGTLMELKDCAYPLLVDIIATDDPEEAFKDVDVVFLVGARPRSEGMERADLLAANAEIFTTQGKALNKVANRNVKVLVIGNPANTNAYIAMKSAPDLNPKNFSAMLRLDQNRAVNQLAEKLKCSVAQIKNVCVWGNHSPTMYPDYRFATLDDKPIEQIINDKKWLQEDFLPTVRERGTAVIKARGLSSAASAANAAINHMHDWIFGTQGKWTTMGVPSDGSYGVPEGIIFGFPVTIDEKGEYTIVPNLSFDEFSQEKINETLRELEEEKAAISHLL